MSAFKKATKEQSKLRLAIFGTSGSGKTYSALSIATGISKKIAVIDSERGTASKYSDRFEFDVCDLDDKTIDGYTTAIKDAGEAGYEVLIIDSLSHAWKELLEEVEKIAQAKFKGNTFSAWSKGTPKQNDFIETILDYPGHVIATMRSKTEWTIEKTSDGKSSPVRHGLAPQQGKDIEYEFDVLLEMTTDHIANVLKDRTGKYQDKIITKPGIDFGIELRDWLSTGEAAKPRLSKEQKEKIALSEKKLTELFENLKKPENQDKIQNIKEKWISWESKLIETDYLEGLKIINEISTVNDKGAVNA